MARKKNSSVLWRNLMKTLLDINVVIQIKIKLILHRVRLFSVKTYVDAQKLKFKAFKYRDAIISEGRRKGITPRATHSATHITKLKKCLKDVFKFPKHSLKVLRMFSNWNQISWWCVHWPCHFIYVQQRILVMMMLMIVVMMMMMQ